MTQQKVFITYSGTVSKAISELVHTWLRHTLHTVDLLYTPAFIKPGQRVDLLLFDLLEKANIALLIYTKEGLNCTRMVFEAGYVSKGNRDACIIPLLFGLSHKELPEPIDAFKCEVFSRNGMWRILKAINNYQGGSGVNEETLKRVFDSEWDGFARDINDVLGNLSNHLLNSARLAAGLASNEGYSATATRQLLQKHRDQEQEKERTRQAKIQLQHLLKKKKGLKEQLNQLKLEIKYLTISLKNIDQRYEQYQFFSVFILWGSVGAMGLFTYSSSRLTGDGADAASFLLVLAVGFAAAYGHAKIKPILHARREIQRFQDEHKLSAKLGQELDLEQELIDINGLIATLEEKKEPSK